MPVNDPGSGQALAGMILGIAGLFLSFFGLVPLLGLIFSIIGMRSVTRKGMAIAGLVTSIIGLVAAIFFTILIVGLIIAAANTPTY
jgi:thiol:disulfide interchange protein